jgi:phage/plasmid-associated DNA primase
MRWRTVGGYLDWREGGMRTPKEVLVATRNYQDEQDPLADYVADRCVRGASNVRVTRGDLFSDYLSWCPQTGEKFPLSRNALFERVRSLTDVRDDQWRVSGQTVPVRGFCGIGIAFSAGVAGSAS